MAASPERIGRYLVQDVIGAGGFATVYRATDERLEVDVAVKVLAENHSIDPEVRERFIEEGRRLRRVRSAHLLEVYDLGDTERAQPYLVMAWADRGDLAGRVASARSRGYHPTPVDVLAVARALAAALGILHRNHLVHRDLAPKNLLLRSWSADANGGLSPSGSRPGPEGAGGAGLFAPDEQILLADLGMSKDLARASGLTVAAGTSGFAPPEQREQGGTVDLRADIWAAGALVVWMALARPPDDAGSWKDQLRGTSWPPAVVSVLERGLAAAPEKRQPTIEDWLGDLEQAFQPSPSSRPVPAQRDGAGHGRGRLRPVVVSAVLAGFLGSGVLGYLVAGRSSDQPSIQVERLPDGDERSVVEQDGVSFTIDGPADVGVGEAVSLTAQVEGAESWTWVAPNGQWESGSVLTFDTVNAGSLTVWLVATNDQGRIIEVAHDIQVSDS